MKRYFFLLFLLLIFQKGKSQITLQYTLDSTVSSQFYCTDIGNNEFKYVFLNSYSNSFSLFNMDMSPYLTNIQIPVLTDSIMKGFTVAYVTKTLFDCDSSNIEYVYEYQYDVYHKFRVFRTDGTLLLEVDSSNGPYGFGFYGGSHDVRPIINTSDGAKLFLQKNDSNQVAQVLIYALCGTLPTLVYDFSDPNSYVKIYPNPAAMQLNFEVNLPNNQEEFQIKIFDSNAKEKQTKSILLQQGKCSLDIKEYSNGIYYYSLSSKNKVYQSGKFIISK